MKRLLTIGLLLLSMSLQAQDLKSLFIALPDTLSPLLTKVNREDFGDFLSNDMKAEVKNRLGSTSEMLKMTDDYLKLKLTSVSEVEMKLLPVNDSTKVVCVVKTYKGPVADSEISFYDTSWRELNRADYLQLPQMDRFFVVPQSAAKQDSLNDLRQNADMYLVKASLSEQEAKVSFTCTAADYLDKETAVSLRRYMHAEPIDYHWLNGRFVEGK